MPKSPGQKLKLLYLKQILEQQSDEQHPLTTTDLIRELARHDIVAERKSIYDDVLALQQYGCDIVVLRGRSNRYFMASRQFQLPELKLLVDAAQSAKFITERKSAQLIRKIASLASRHEAALLQRQVYVQGRVKAMNESIYYTVDVLQSAIAQGCAIRCHYYEWVVAPKNSKRYARQFRRGGAAYSLSPWALLWDDENYYLLAWDSDASMLKHFRVDKLDSIEVLNLPRQGREAFEALDMAEYTKRRFGMFGGEEQAVKIRFANRLIGVVVDRFGKDIGISLSGEQHFTINVRAVVSPQLFAWIMGFGNEAELLGPPDARDQLCETLKELAGLYRIK